MLFLTEDLSLLTHNCSLAHAGSPRECPPRLDPEANFGAGGRANNLAAPHPKEDKENNGKYKGGND
jgi:hypothetical protein